eukprot:3300579-Rhodomonas_salina.2
MSALMYEKEIVDPSCSSWFLTYTTTDAVASPPHGDAGVCTVISTKTSPAAPASELKLASTAGAKTRVPHAPTNATEMFLSSTASMRLGRPALARVIPDPKSVSDNKRSVPPNSEPEVGKMLSTVGTG